MLALCLALALVGLAGCGSDKKEDQSQQESQRIAQDFAEAEATFKFDGMIETKALHRGATGPGHFCGDGWQVGHAEAAIFARLN